MASIVLTIKKFELRKNGAAPIVFCFSTRKGVVYQNTGKYILPKYYDKSSRHIIGKKNIALDYEMQDLLMKYSIAFATLSERVEVSNMHPNDFRDKVLSMANSTRKGAFLIDRLEAFSETKQSPRTKELYQMTIKRVKEFCQHWECLLLDDISKEWLRRFDAWLEERGNRPNSRSIHFRNIRTIFNESIDDALTTNYPFRRFQLPKEETKKRCLSVEELRSIKNAELEGIQAEARDIFMLTFYLIGINISDLYGIEPTEGDFIEYRRNKTGRLFKIKIQDEARNIIEAHKGTKKLLNTCERYRSTHNMGYRINNALKGIKSDLTLYWARHTWATIAAEIDIPKETISRALGHSTGTVTDIYIKYNDNKVDEANRKVIDFVTGL